MGEIAILALIFMVGWLLLSGLGMRGWGIMPLAFITGTFTTVVVGSVLVVTGLPTVPWAIVCGVVTVSIAIFVLGKRKQHLPIKFLLTGLIILVPLAWLFRTANLVSYHIDSFRYLVVSGMLATDTYSYGDFVSVNLIEKRMLSSPVVHSLAEINGEWYLQAFGPLMSIALMAFTVWVIIQAGDAARRNPRRNRRLMVIAGLAVLLIATNNRMIWNSFYLNQHLMFGVAFLVACCAAWISSMRSDSPWMVGALCLSLPVLVMSRPEGFIAAGLAAIPLIVSDVVSRRSRALVLATLSVSCIVWFGYVSLARFAASGGFSLESIGPVLAGLLGLIFIPVLWWDQLVTRQHGVLIGFEVLLWLALTVFALKEPETLVVSVHATLENVVMGAGSWGYSLVCLVLIAMTAWFLVRSRTLVYLRFPLTALVPVFFLLAYMRGGPYRIDNGDSLNRMLMHIVPVAVVYIAAAARLQADKGG